MQTTFTSNFRFEKYRSSNDKSETNMEGIPTPSILILISWKIIFYLQWEKTKRKKNPKHINLIHALSELQEIYLASA